MAYKVIDVSYWQGTSISWTKVKAAGVQGAILRVGYGSGGTIHSDSSFARNVKEVRRVGLHWGAYFYSGARTATQAKKEAQYLYEQTKAYSPDMPLYIDLEESSLKGYAKTVAKVFMAEMKRLGGKPGIYANLNWFNNYIDTSSYRSEPLWIAQYNDRITHSHPDWFGMWQYSSSGSVAGISGRVDMNQCYVEYWKNASTGESAAADTAPKETTVRTEWFSETDLKALQAWTGTVQDGVLSGQHKESQKFYPAVADLCGYGSGGSNCIRELQRRCGETADGILGTATIKGVQRLVGADQDGYWGPATSEAVRKFIASNPGKLISKAAAMSKEMTAAGFRYSNTGKNLGSTYAEAKAKGYTNCATFVSWTLQEAGFLPQGDVFYCKDGKINNYRGSASTDIKKTAVVSYPKKAPASAGLKPGDIVGYEAAHTMIFACFNSAGKPLFYTMGSGDIGKQLPRIRTDYTNRIVAVRARLK